MLVVVVVGGRGLGVGVAVRGGWWGGVGNYTGVNQCVMYIPDGAERILEINCRIVQYVEERKRAAKAAVQCSSI